MNTTNQRLSKTQFLTALWLVLWSSFFQVGCTQKRMARPLSTPAAQPISPRENPVYSNLEDEDLTIYSKDFGKDGVPTKSPHRTLPSPEAPEAAASTGTYVERVQPAETMPSHPAFPPVETALPPAPTVQMEAIAPYVIKKGDTLTGVAQRAGISLKHLLALNPKQNLTAQSHLKWGNVLMVPKESRARLNQPRKVAQASTPSGKSTASHPSKKAHHVNPGNKEKRDSKAPYTGPTQEHVLEEGETIAIVAQQYGVRAADVLELNKITNPRKLQIGQKLLIPSVGPAPSSASVSPLGSETHQGAAPVISAGDLDALLEEAQLENAPGHPDKALDSPLPEHLTEEEKKRWFDADNEQDLPVVALEPAL